MNTADLLIVGGGVIGLSLGRELKRQYADSSVTVLEKEAEVGLHASGRNSGVLHAGFYYTADSLKARFTRQGNQYWTEYCASKKIPINRCGKLVVAQSAADLPMMDELLSRGRVNGVALESLSEDQAKKIEPRVKTHQRAIFSPSTSSVNPTEVMKAVAEDFLNEGGQIHRETAYVGRKGERIMTTQGEYQAGYVVNSSGLYADRIARDFGFSEHYRVLPFKGLYLYSEEPPGALKTNIYPVPDLKYPFLGVHFTVTADGHMKIGPTAIPALWREQYGGWEGFDMGEFIEIAIRQLGMLGRSNFDFKKLAVEEIMKYSRSRMVRLASRLVKGVSPRHFHHWGPPGIRAQLVDVRTRKLEMDFLLEGDRRSMHILNAVSPGFTCAVPFSRHVVDQIAAHL